MTKTRRWMTVAALTAAAVAAASLAPQTAWAKKPRKPKFKVHFAFGGDTTYADPPTPRKGDAPPTVYGATISSTPVWVLSSSIDTKTDYRNVSLSIAQLDFASLTYPYEMPANQVLQCVYGTGTRGSSPQVTGYWGSSKGVVSVTLTSYDAKRRRLSGTFTALLKDAATMLVLPDLNLTGGDFGVVIPKPR